MKKKRKNQLMEELDFCINLWRNQDHCEFGGYTKCENCGAPYVLYKMITGEVLHGDIERLTLKKWEEKLAKLKKEFEENE